MRLNPDLRLTDIEIRNPGKMTLEALEEVRDQIYSIPPDELIKPEGNPIARYLRKVNEELGKRLRR